MFSRQSVYTLSDHRVKGDPHRRTRKSQKSIFFEDHPANSVPKDEFMEIDQQNPEASLVVSCSSTAGLYGSAAGIARETLDPTRSVGRCEGRQSAFDHDRGA